MTPRVSIKMEHSVVYVIRDLSAMASHVLVSGIISGVYLSYSGEKMGETGGG